MYPIFSFLFYRTFSSRFERPRTLNVTKFCAAIRVMNRVRWHRNWRYTKMQTPQDSAMLNLR